MFHHRHPSLSVLLALALSAALPASGGVVINEILYRPGTAFPENTAREFIELLNTDPAPIDVSGWSFTDGVAYTFPAGTIIPAGSFAVVAADPAVVQTTHGITGVLGPWQGTLSNNGERITLSRPDPTPGAPAGSLEVVDDVNYASEGDWATRIRETTFNGWAWDTPANGGNRSMELRNAALSNDNGQNWAASTGAGGATPKAANSAATTNVAPIIRDVKHSPGVPRSTEPVTITCELTDESPPAGLTATLFWRNATAATPGPFQSTPMIGDGADRYSATLAPLANLSIVEFYISAGDGTNTRTWPAPTSEGQNANAQYQVTNEVLALGESYYFLVLTGAENAAYNATAPQDSAGNKIDRQFNTTVIVASETGDSIRYQSSIRFRGNSSRSYQFKPLRVSIPLDDRLGGVSDFNLHPRGSYIQYIGYRAFQAAGVRAHDAIPVEMRRNGIEYTSSTGGTADFGKWVRVEDVGGDFVDNHWPEVNSGNAYRKTRPDEFWRATQAAPNNPDALLDGWSKQNNSSANDWSDLTGFFQTWQTVAASHFSGENLNDVNSGTWNDTAFSDSEVATIETVSDLDQWARWFAVMTILQDNETNISNGQDDDYAAYFEPDALGQRRMDLLPHDLDTVLGRGDTPLAGDARGLYDMTDENSVFTTLLPLFGNNTTPGNAAFRTKYHNAIRELYGTVFNADTTSNPYPPFYAFLDNHLAGWVPTGTIDQIKTFATQRQAHLLGLIGSGPIIPPTATSTGTLTSTHGPLMISEVLANNVAASQNGATFPDVIELHNAGAAPADLTGMSLTDDPALPGKFPFPAGTTIPAGEFLLVYADADTAAPGLHAGFALDQDGDQVQLYNGAAVVDSIVFGPQTADRSISRTGAALDVWALTAPTLGAPNGAPVALGPVSGILINELFTNPDYLSAEDFAEIYNPATQPVALGGVKVTDDSINYPGRHTLPPLSFIGARGFLALFPKGNDASPGNPTELPFKFSSDSTWAAIIGANGTIIDQLDTNALPPDVSRGRSPDGGTALVNFGLPASIPTPGAANVAPPAGILALLNQLRITELLYKPNNLEFLELQNIGPATLDLSGVHFTGGITYTFPPNQTLAPGAFIVICKDRAAFTTQYGGAVPLAPGVFTGTLDNAGERVAFQPPPPWNVNVLSFEYETDWYPLTESDHSLVVRDPSLSLARDWDEKETWNASPQPFGTPGAGAPPTITGPLTAFGALSTPFSYQIIATQAPTSYSATGLPAGLTVDTGTGLISGTPTEQGVFNVIIGAANAAGSDTETLVLTISDAGPLAGFEWNPVPAPQTAGIPFTVTLRARDAVGRTVTTYQGQAQISAQRPVSSPSVVFTEFGTSTPTPDYFEIQNVTTAAVDTTGWFVLTNASTTGVNAALGTSWLLPASLAPSQLIGATDAATPDPNESPYGVDIDWPGAAPRGWAMLVDNTGAIRDFVAWGYTAAEIATINFTHSGFNFTVGTQWSGNGAPTIPGGQSLFRGGTSDNHQAGDWALGPTPSPRVTQNTGLTVPMLPQFTAVSGVPTGSVDFVNGIWTGAFTVREVASNAELQATATGFPIARSNAFAVIASTSNTPPTFVKGADQSVPEDAPAQSITGWATDIFPGAASENGIQTVSFLVSSDNSTLFSSAPAVEPDGTLRFTPALNANGVATVTVRARDTGGTANGGIDTSAPQTFTITVLPVNDAPTIVAGPNVIAGQNSGSQTLPGWASNITAGSADEAGQTLDIQLTAANPGLFASQPALTPDGTLSFTLDSSVSGVTNVTIIVSDSGGTANGGVDRTQRTFTITSRPVNLPPSFLAGLDVTAPVLALYSQPWATDILPGPPSESSQTVTFVVTTNRPDLFKIPPAISPAGVLTFQGTKEGGTAVVTVMLRDNAGTADGGNDTSAPQTFNIQLTSSSAAAGKYRGLIEAPAGTPAAHGRLGRVEISVNAKGSFTGKVQLGGESYGIRGKLDGTGASIFGRRDPALQLKRKGQAPLLFSFRGEVIESNPQLLTGEINDGVATFARFAAEPDGYSKQNRVPLTLLNPSVNRGNYTALFEALPAPNGGLTEQQYPQGDGWTTLRVGPTGVVKLRGRFADGSKFSYSSGLNAANSFPIYAPLYRKAGAVGGKAGFLTTDPVRLESNGLTWFRPVLGTPLYPSGWSGGILLGFDGTARNVVTEPNALPVGNATLTLTGGNLPAGGLTKPLAIGLNNRVDVLAAGADKMSIKLKASGEVSGNFIHPVTGRKTTLSGVTLRDPSEASGFFPGSSESGRLTIEPGP